MSPFENKDPTALRIGFIGAGRLGCALAWSFGARGTLESIASAGLADGMPGPVSRSDVGSIEKHVAALSPLGPEVMEFYRVVCDRTIPLGIARGAIDDDEAARLREILRGSS